MVLCELNQVAERTGDTPCSSLQMSIAINMVMYVALWPEFKKIIASCIAFLPIKSNLNLWSLNYRREKMSNLVDASDRANGLPNKMEPIGSLALRAHQINYGLA